MGIWRDKSKGTWSYLFQYKGKRHGGGGLATKREARKARELKRIKIAGMSGIVPPTKDLDALRPVTDLLELKERYRLMVKNPKNTLPVILELLMKDLDLPFKFSDILKVARNIDSNGKAKIPSKLRMIIFRRDQFTCKICGRKPPEIIIHADHIIPISRGGLTEERNLQTLCSDCNFGKGSCVDQCEKHDPVAVSGYGSDGNQEQSTPLVSL